MNFIKALLLGTLLYGTAQAAESLTVDKTRLVPILGRIDGSIVEKANALVKLANKSTKPVFLMVNSPGGSVRAGKVFIDAMEIVKSRGVTINCFTTTYAASMAFSILMHCDNRYVLENVTLLFHPIRIRFAGPLTAQLSLKMHEAMQPMDNALLNQIEDSLNIDHQVMVNAFYDEKWWDAKELRSVINDNWMTIVKDIKGIDGVFALEDSDLMQGDHEGELARFGYVFLN